MSYKNFFVYVQKQINRFLKLYHVYVKTYINNIMIFSKTLKKHEQYFRQIFIILQINNIIIKLEKIFLNYSSVQFLNKKKIFFDFATTKNKLKTISKFQFSRILRQLKILFEFNKLISWIHFALCRNCQIVTKSKNEAFSIKLYKEKRSKNVFNSNKNALFYRTKKNILFHVLISIFQIVISRIFEFQKTNIRRFK